MKYLQNIWRSAVCFLISAISMSLLLLGACKVTPMLFQDSVWAKIGILAVGIEIGVGVLYFAMMLITGSIMVIAQYRKTPVILSILPILFALIRYPWWLISVCNLIPYSLGFWQWLIVIAWIIAWIVMLAISIGTLFSNMNEYKN